MNWELRDVPAELRARYVAAGHWTDDTFASFIEREVGAAPDASASGCGPTPTRSRERSAACTSSPCGWQRGSTAAASGSATSSPTSSRTGPRPSRSSGRASASAPSWCRSCTSTAPREVEFILKQSGAKLLVTVDRFGHVDHLENLREIRDACPRSSTSSSSRAERRASSCPARSRSTRCSTPRPSPEPPTSTRTARRWSGTRRAPRPSPKGVVHTHRSLLFETRQLAALDAASGRPPARRVAARAHDGAPRGEPAARLPARPHPSHRSVGPGQGAADHGGGRHRSRRRRHRSSSRACWTIRRSGPSTSSSSGASASAARRSRPPSPSGPRRSGSQVLRAYGSTEHPSITGSTPDEPQAKRNRTDGHALEGVEIRLVDDEATRGRPPGSPARSCRGARPVRRLHRPRAHRARGDRRRLVPHRRRRRARRRRLPDDHRPAERRDHPRRPEPLRGGDRRGAHARCPPSRSAPSSPRPTSGSASAPAASCGCVPAQDAPDLAAVQAHLGAVGLPKQKWIEELRVVNDFPRTPSGKIRKFVVRAELRKAT